MSESPFVTTHNIICEQANAVDELRIVARDEQRLSQRDREALVRAADELETAQRAVAMLYGQLIEARQQLAAVGERLAAANAKLMQMPLSLTAGPVAFQIQNWGWPR